MVRKCSFFVFLKYMMIQLPNSEIIFKFHFAFKVNGKTHPTYNQEDNTQ